MLSETFPVSVPGLVVLGSSLYVIYTLIRAAIDPLRDVPGPLLARFSRLWYLGTIYKGEFELVNVALHKKYGPVVRIAPNQYSIDDVDSAKVIYGHGNDFVKVGVVLLSKHHNM